MSSLAFRTLSTTVRVRDLDRSVAFYSGLFGARVLRRMEFPDRRSTLVLLGYGSEDCRHVIGLSHYWEEDNPHPLGHGYGHVALAVRDIRAVCRRLEADGALIPREPGPTRHGGLMVASVEDPDGYRIELIDLDTIVGEYNTTTAVVPNGPAELQPGTTRESY